MSKMTRKGEYVKCPRCGGQARVVWVSQDEKTAAIKCMGYHSHIGPPAKPRGKNYYYKTKTKAAKGMVFLIEATKSE